MRIVTLLSSLVVLSACDEGVADFESELNVQRAAAWQICKEGMFEEDLDEVPIAVQEDEYRITFIWDPKKAELFGGSIYCTTDGTGTELIEFRTSAGF